MILDEALQSAKEQLNLKGQLLNSQLLKLVEGDEGIYREVRETLIFEGLAVDRFGVGLAKANTADASAPTTCSKSVSSIAVVPTPSAPASAEIAAVTSPVETDGTRPIEGWWWMAGGKSSGPVEKSAIDEMWQVGDLGETDFVRQGIRGVWQRSTDALGPRTNPLPRRSKEATPVPVAETKRTTLSEPGYYFWESGRSIGPVTRQDLEERLKAGRITLDAFVQVGEDGDWQPVSSVVNQSGGGLDSATPKHSTSDSDVDINEVDASPQGHPTVAVISDATETDVEQDVISDPIARKNKSRANPASRTTAPQKPSKTGGKRAETPRKSQTEVPTTVAATVSTVTASAGQRLSILSRGWKSAARFVGGESRLWMIGACIGLIIGGWYWWTMPPSSRTVYREFMSAYNQFKELRADSTDPARLNLKLSRHKSRVEVLIRGLKSSRGGASSRVPAKQELLWAGENELLKLLENPQMESRQELDLERQFEAHMQEALRLIEGGSPASSPAGADVMTGGGRPAANSTPHSPSQ